MAMVRSKLANKNLERLQSAEVKASFNTRNYLDYLKLIILDMVYLEQPEDGFSFSLILHFELGDVLLV